MKFETVFNRVVNTEGGFTNNPKDKGNWTGKQVGKGELKGTKFGIAANTYPDLSIVNLTIEDAKIIYKRDWWDKNGIERFSSAMQFQMFDAAFNHGMRNASKIFQRAVGADDDGFIGQLTMARAANFSENDQLLLFLSYRLNFFTSLDSFKTFGRGWVNRIAENLRYAAEDN